MLLTPLPSPSNLGSGFTNRPIYRVLVVGGSYAGLSCILSLLDLLDGKPAKPTLHKLPDFAGYQADAAIEIILLDERDGFFHTVGAPLAHTSQRHVERFWKPYSSLAELRHPTLRIIRGRLTHVDAENLVASYTASESHEIRHVAYEYLVLATGLSRQWPIIPRSHYKARFVSDSTALISKLASSQHTVVIGGGAVGIEIAGELKHFHPKVRVTLVHSRQELFSNEPLPPEFKSKALECLREEGVDVILGQRATSLPIASDTSIEQLQLIDGTILSAGVVINATARCPPNTEHLPKQALDSSGYVELFPSMMFPSSAPNHEQHYAIGDIAAVKGIKRAGGALVMGRTAAANIWAQIITEKTHNDFNFGEYPEVSPVMGLAVGEQAIGYTGADLEGKGGIVTAGVDVMAKLFGDDLGWATCLKFMGFSETRSE